MAKSVILRLPYSIIEKLSREAKKLDMSVKEYVIELISSSLDPLERAHEYIEASLSLLEQAIEEVKRGDIRQGAEKLWGATSLAIKAYAWWRDKRRLVSHGELWEYRRIVEKELGEWVYDSWMVANSMHICFYEGWCSREDLEEAYKRIKRLIEEIAKRIRES